MPPRSGFRLLGEIPAGAIITIAILIATVAVVNLVNKVKYLSLFFFFNYRLFPFTVPHE